jgi:phosphatidylserine/phosphatidylglycerophosphate/cardiolipin synthase-like enzyme
LKPYWGKLTVRNFREGAGNVSYGRTRNPLRHRKSGERKLPTYGCARLCSTRPLILLARVALAAEVTPARVAVYFSPSGGATDAVVREVHAATQQILVQAYSFTSAPIAKALVDAHKRGVKIFAVLDKSNETDKYSAATFLVNAGVQTLIDDQHAIAHNKVMVIDGATIITGSFNFTRAAEEKNAENLLVIKDAPELVKAYEATIQAHAAHAHPYARRSAGASSPATPRAPASGEVHGNRNSKVYRVPGCKSYAGMNPASVVPFATEAEAQHAGYRKAKDYS